VLEDLEDGVIACDATGVLRLFNRAARRFHGLPESSAPAAEWPERYSVLLLDQTSPRGMVHHPLHRALSGEVVRDVEMVIAPKHGKRRVVRANGRAIVGRSGRKLGAVLTMHDTTPPGHPNTEQSGEASADQLPELVGGAALTGPRTQTLRVGHLEIDVAARAVVASGRSVAVTAKEFDLLAFLATHPGQVFSRDELLREVWRSATDRQRAATVTEHVRRLRKKVELDPRRPQLLLTIRGAGYRLDPLAEELR
jgi:PAS domain S-box-containing protein